MNATTTAERNALTLPQRAALALESTKAEAELRELVAKSADITAVIDPAGREQAHRIGMTLKTARVAIEKTGKAAREDAQAFAKAVIAEEKRLVDIVTPEETRVFGLRDAYDAKVEAERQAKIEAERVRVEGIKARIQEMRDLPAKAIGKTADQISSMIFSVAGSIRADGSDVADFEEFADQFRAARADAIELLAKAETAQRQAEQEAARLKAEQEAEAARIAAERAELARLRAEAAERERIAKEEADREAARQAEEQRKVAEEQARIAAEQRAEAERLQVEAARLEAERARTAEAERQKVEAAAQSVLPVAPEQIPVKATAAVLNPAAAWPAPTSTPTLRLGQINDRLGFNVNAEFLTVLGFPPAATEKAAKLYHESSFPAICSAIAQHVMCVASGAAHPAAA